MMKSLVSSLVPTTTKLSVWQAKPHYRTRFLFMKMSLFASRCAITPWAAYPPCRTCDARKSGKEKCANLKQRGGCQRPIRYSAITQPRKQENQNYKRGLGESKTTISQRLAMITTELKNQPGQIEILVTSNHQKCLMN